MPVPLATFPTVGASSTKSTVIVVLFVIAAFNLTLDVEDFIWSIVTVSKTFTAKPSDSLYKISIEETNKEGLILSTSNGNGILSNTLVTLFSINSTIVLLNASCSSSTFIRGSVLTLYIK